MRQYDLKIREDNLKKQVFDIVRKKFVALTPEEIVRQTFVHFLINEKKVPRSLIAVEMGLQLNDLQKRSDVVVFDRTGKPLVMVECKSPGVNVTQSTFDQIARYNMALKVPYLIVTNGNVHYGCRIDFENNQYRFMEDLPNYDML